MLKSINQIRVELQEIANAHLQINNFFWGDFLRAYKENTELNYVLMGCFYPTASLLRNQTQLTLTIYIADRVYKDYSNLNDVESDTLQICRDVFNVMNSSQRWRRLGRVQSASCQKFIERGGDEVAGHTLTVNFLVRDQSGICELPMQGYDFDQNITSDTCDPAELQILDGDGNTLYSLTLLSGTTGNQTIQDSTVSNSDATYTATVNAEGSLVLPDITVTDSDGSTFTSPSVNNVTCTPSPNTDLEVNGVSEGSVVAGSTVDVQLINTTPNTVTPLSVTQLGNDFTVELDDITYDIYVNGVFNTSTTLPYGENNTLNITI